MMTNFVRKDRPQPSDPDYVPTVGRLRDIGGPLDAAGARGDRCETPQQRRSAWRRLLRECRRGVMLRPSVGEHGTVFVTGRDAGPGSRAVRSRCRGEHYNMIVRMLAGSNLPVKLRVNVQSTFYDNEGGNTYNVLAELPGSDPALGDEVVMIGAHLDSWHTGVGATDNADGSTTVMEAMRILKAIGARPRRTIRVALWGGEEQGLLGSKAWVAQHLAGDGQRRRAREVLGLLQHRQRQRSDLRLVPAEQRGGPADLRRLARAAEGARRAPQRDRTGRDRPITSASSMPACPASTRSRITSTTTSARTTPTWTPSSAVNIDDLRQAAIVMATFAYQAANLDRKLPR